MTINFHQKSFFVYRMNWVDWPSTCLQWIWLVWICLVPSHQWIWLAIQISTRNPIGCLNTKYGRSTATRPFWWKGILFPSQLVKVCYVCTLRIEIFIFSINEFIVVRIAKCLKSRKIHEDWKNAKSLTKTFARNCLLGYFIGNIFVNLLKTFIAVFV